MRVLALTGVPGTGKTTVAGHLAHRYPVIDVGELAEQVGAVVDRDDARASDVVDEQMLWDRAREALPDADVIVEGVLAHFCQPDLVVLLRCHPDQLRARLDERAWPPAKVEENVMAETLDAIASEIETEPAWELDATDLDPAAAAGLIAGLFKGESLTHPHLHALGGVEWSHTLLGEE